MIEETKCEPVKNVDVKNSLENYVSYYNPRRGFGFIYNPVDQTQLFFHLSDVKNLYEIGKKIELFDTVVSFDVGASPRDGREKAFNVILKRKEVVDQAVEEESEEMVSDG
jgi:cold shock CspA family protein